MRGIRDGGMREVKCVRLQTEPAVEVPFVSLCLAPLAILNERLQLANAGH